MAATQGGTLGGLMGSGMSGLAVATHVRNKALGPDVDPQIGVEQPLSPQAVTQASPTQNGVSALTKIVHSDMAPDGGQAAPVAGRGSTQSLPALFQPALQPRANPDTLSAADPDPVRPAQPVDKQPTGTMSNAGMVSTGNETPVMASPSKSGGISIDPRGIAPGQQTDLEAGRHEALYRDAQQRRRDGGLYVMQQLEARAANEQALATQQAKPAYQRARAMWLDAEAQLRLLDARKQAAAPPLKIDRQSDTGTANQIADLHEQRGSQTPPVANSPQQVPQLVQQRRMNHRVQSTPVQAARTMPQQSPIVLAAPVVGPLPRSQSQAELARTTPGAVTAVPAVAERQAPATQIAPDSQQPVSSGQGQPISRAPLAQAYAKAYKLAGTHEVMPAEGGGYVRWPRAGGTSGSMAAQARLAVPVAPPAQTAASYSTQAGRRSDAPTKGTRAPVIRVALQARISQWQNAPKINVVQSVAELPAHLRAQIERDGAQDLEGLYDGDSVYLVGDNLRSPQQAAFVLLHEVLGHAGLRGVFGDGLNPLMNSIYRDHADVREDADRLMQQYGYDKALAVEEVLADRAAMGQAREASWWQKIMLAFKNYLRQNGFGWAVTKWSDAEIEQLLASA